jgi:predicted alpha-1,6-mannanase (GH76 family)
MDQPEASATPADRPLPGGAATAQEWAGRATEAARSVTRMFGQRLFFLPGTHLAATARPAGWFGNLAGPWHYWWQAHYLDCLVDTGRRELGAAGQAPAPFDGDPRPSAGRLAPRLVTGIWLRNFFTFVNNYYDDMAWLALSALRLEKLAEESRRPNPRRHARIRKSLTLQFDAASTDDLGGGTFWSKKRDFKNTPATAPVALYYARTGQRDKAQALVDWLDMKLFDAGRGLYLDGLRIGPTGETKLENAVYTYNQGPVLGALLELGGEMNLERAAVVVDAVAEHLTLGGKGTVLRCDGTGDGGLFTGILVRYLALAARDGRLAEPTRTKAARLVTDTAEALWSGRRRVAPGEALAGHGGTGRLIFSYDPRRPASDAYPAGAAVELSTQLQAWMVLEAAAAVTAGRSGSPGR